MLKKRIIPCLDVKDGQTVKGVNFLNIRYAGDAVELAKEYVKQGADELVFLDITATVEKRKTLAALVSKISREINIPFTVGGGINNTQDVEALLNAGADKISINSSAVNNPRLINELSKNFGSQCIVLAVDTDSVNSEWMVFVNGGRTITSLKTCDWIKEAEQRGAGEILLTSMANDGTKNGFALELTKMITASVSIPVIASGGAGAMEHFAEVFARSGADAALAASVFHFGEIKIPLLKKYLQDNNIPVRI